MAIYTFYPCRDDGNAATFEAIELLEDEATGPVAAAILARHESAASVAIWQSDRYVGHVKREVAGLFGARSSPITPAAFGPRDRSTDQGQSTV